MAKLDIDGYEYAYLKAIVLFSPGKAFGNYSLLLNSVLVLNLQEGNTLTPVKSNAEENATNEGTS